MGKLDEFEDLYGDDEEETEPAAQADEVKELEQLRAYKAQTETAARESAVVEAFKEAGLDPRSAKLYALLNEGEPNAELVKKFAEDYGLVPEPDRRGFTPTVIQGGHIPAAKMFSKKEFEDIMRVNPARGRALADAGKVKWNNLEQTR